MTSVIADDAGLRRDLRIARHLGVSLRRFHGWEPPQHTHTHPDGSTTTIPQPEYDAYERALWRALEDWEAGLCPDCGQPLHLSLWDPDQPAEERAKWRALYSSCRACLELENAQNKVADDDKQTQERLKLEQPPPHRHRKWRVERDDEKGR